MPTFMVSGDDSPILEKFLNDTNERLKNPDMMKNPFNGYVLQIKSGDTRYGLIKMKTIVPNISWAGFALFLLIELFCIYTKSYYSWWLILPALIMLSGFIHTPKFCVIAIKASLKKYNYKGILRLYSGVEFKDFMLDELAKCNTLP